MGKNFYSFFSRMMLVAVLLCCGVVSYADELTVNASASQTCGYVPIYGSYLDTRGSFSQVVYPASLLDEIPAGSQITGITFYASAAPSSGSWTGSESSIKLMEIEGTSLSAFVSTTSATEVFNGNLSLPSSSNGLATQIVFTTPFDYNGGNLLIEHSCSVAGSWSYVNWLCVSSTNAGRYSTSASGSGSAQNFLPKMTITYTPAAVSCSKPASITASNVDDTSADLAWVAGGSETSWELTVSDGTNRMVTVESATSKSLTGLNANTLYTASVRAICGVGDTSVVRSVTFRTECGTVVFPWHEDFESYAAGAQEISCFIGNVHLSGAGASVFKVAASTTGNSTHCMYLPDQSAGTKTLLSLPQMNIPTANDYEFKISIYRSATGTSYTTEGLRIFVNSTELGFISRNYTVADAAHGVPAESASGWYTYSFTIPVAGVDTIKIQGENQYGSATYFDDLEVRQKPTCRPGVDFSISAVDAHSATLTWSAANGETEWQLKYKLTGDNVTHVVNVTDTAYQITGLNAGKNYAGSAVLHAVCDGELSPDSIVLPLSFATNCELFSLPYSENFDAMTASAGVVPTCYSAIQFASTYTTPDVYNYTAHSGSNCIRFYPYNATATSEMILVLPDFDESLVFANSRITFWYKNYSTGSGYGRFVVGTMSDKSDASTFHPLDTLEQVSSYTWYEQYLTEAVPTDSYIAIRLIRGTSSYDYSHLIDDIAVSEIPTCRPGKNFSNSAVGIHSATLTWSAANGETEWQLKYKLTGDSVTHVVNVTDTTYQITGLGDAKSYTGSAVLHAVCDGELSPDSLMLSLSFTTDCDLVSTFPWQVGFESTEGFTVSTSVGSTSTKLATCWTSEVTFSDGGSYTTRQWAVLSGSSAYKHSGSAALILQDKGGASKINKTLLRLPVIDVPTANDYEMTLWVYRNGTASSTPEGFRIFVSRTDTIDESAVEIGLISRNYGYASDFAGAEEAGGWYRYSFALPFAGETHVLFQGESYYGSSTFVDDIEVRQMPSCRPGTDLKVNSVNYTTATIGWGVANGETEWEVKYKPSTATEYTVANVTTNSLQLTGLHSGTAYTYNVILHSVCEGALSVDSVVKTLKFATECEEMVALDDTIRYVAESVLGPCYATFVSEGTGTTVWSTYTAYKYGDEAYSFYVSSPKHSVLALPMTEIPEDAELLFQAREGYSHYAADTIRVWVNDSVTLNGATLLGTDTFPSTVEWNLYRHRLPEGGHGKYIMLEANAGTSSYGSFYVADLHIAPAPNCQPATNLTLSDLTTTTATFSWEAGGEEIAWSVNVEGGIDSLAEGSVYLEEYLEEMTYTVEELTPATTYVLSVKVLSDCGDGNEATEYLTKQFTFTTPCEPLDLSGAAPGDTILRIGFEIDDELESFATGTLTQANHPCWNVSSNYAWYVNKDYAHSDSASLYTSTTYSNPWIALPGMTIDADDYELSFWARADEEYDYGGYYSAPARRAPAATQSLSYANDSIVVYVNTLQSLEGATRVGATPLLTDAFKQYSFRLPEGARFVILRGYNNTSSYYYDPYIYVDDIAIERMPSCRKVQNLKLDEVSSHEASFSWVAGNEETEWSLLIKRGNDTIFNDVVSSTTFSIDTLQPATNYSFSVRVAAICDGEEAPESVAQTFSFSTDCEAIQLSATESWFEGAESLGGSTRLTTLSPCYSEVSNAYQYWTTSTYFYHSGSKGFYNSASSYYAAKDTLALPVMNIPEANEYEFVFSMYRTSSYASDSITIFLTDDGSVQADDAKLFIVHKAIASAPVEAAAGWYTYHIALPEAGNKRIVIAAAHSYSSGETFYIDDLKVRKIPTCAAATSLHVDTVSASSATLAWCGEAAQYKLGYKCTNDTTISGEVLVADTAYTISGLQSGISYTFKAWVVSVCSDTDEAVDTLSATLSATTECAVIAALPYEYGFEDVAYSSLPNCWTFYQYQSYSKFPYISTTTPAEGTKTLYWYGAGSSAKNSMAVLPEFDETINLNECRLQFALSSYATSSSYTYGELVVGSMISPSDTASFVALDTIHRTTVASRDYELYLTNVPAGHHCLALKYQGGNSDGACYTDRFKVSRIPTCFPGTGLHVIDSLTTFTSVSFGWSPYAEDNLNAHVFIKCGADTLANVDVNDTVYTLSGLEKAHRYNLSVAVRTVCDDLTSDDAIAANITVSTACDVIASFPWSEDFNSLTAAEGLPVCWDNSEGTTSNASYRWSYSASGKTGAGLVFNSYSNPTGNTNILSTPTFNLYRDAIFRFDWKNPTGGAFKVQISVDGAAAVDLKTLSSGGNIWNTEEIDLTAYTGHNVNILFHSTSNYGSGDAYHYLDNVQVVKAPTCQKVKDIVKGAVTESSADFSWTSQGSESQWLVRVVSGTAVLDSVMVDAPAYTLSGLAANTAYSITLGVTSYCGLDENEEEDFAEAVSADFTFRTQVPADAIESLTPGQTFTADFSDADEQAKWIFIGDDETNHFVFGTAADALVPGATTGLYITNTTDGTNPYAYSNNSSSAAAVVRKFHIGVDSATVRVRLNWKANGESTWDYGRAFWSADSVEVSVANHNLKLNTQSVAPGTSYYASTTAGATALQDSVLLTNATKLNLATTWQTINQQITLSTHGDYKLVIGWGNDGSGGYQSPLAVGNIEVSLEGGVVPTSLDGIDADDSETAVKFIHDGHVYIRFRGVIYNSLGQMVSSLH